MRPAEENEAGPELAEESPTDLPAQRAGDRTEDEEVDSDSLSSDETVVGLTETVTSDVPDDSRPDPLWIEPDGIRAAKVLPEEEQDSSNDTTKPRGSASVLATLIVAHTSIEGRAELCVDTGADVTICTKKFIVDHLGPQALSLVDPRGKLPNLMSASYHPMKALGRIHLFVYLGTYKLDIRVIVQDEDRHSSFLLGSDAFYGKIVIDKGKFLAFGNSNHSPVPIRYRLSNEKATVVGCISIPPHTVSYVPVKVTDDPQLTGKEVCLEAADYTNLSLEDWLDGGLYTEPVSNSISEIDSDGIARVLVQNRSDDVLTFTHGLELVKVSLIQEDDYEATHESEEVCSINKVVDYSQPLDENIQKLLTQEKLSKMLPVLHVLSPEGCWEDRQWDCHFRTPSADWGVAGFTGDDCSLDRDDTDGWGPENVSLDDPAAGTFKVGVHYWSDHGFGVSYATVIITLDGIVAYEVRDKALPSTGSWWEVCAVSWPSRNVVPIDRITATVPVCL